MSSAVKITEATSTAAKAMLITVKPMFDVALTQAEYITPGRNSIQKSARGLSASSRYAVKPTKANGSMMPLKYSCGRSSRNSAQHISAAVAASARCKGACAPCFLSSASSTSDSAYSASGTGMSLCAVTRQ